MEQIKTREEFLKRLEASKQRKHEIVEQMKEDIKIIAKYTIYSSTYWNGRHSKYFQILLY